MGAAINHLWQSTLFAGAAALLALGLRRNSAGVRFWIWLSASLKFLLPFALLTALGSRVEWAPARNIARSAVSSTVVEINEPFPASFAVAPVPRNGVEWTAIAMAAVWACGFVGLVLFRLRGWRTVRAAVRGSSPVGWTAGVEIRESVGLLEPGVVGIRRPVLLMPAGIGARMTSAQLNAVIAHELCHVRRRDNLWAALHMVVEAVFWFHPLVWWIGARLVEERERACDEAVLEGGSAPAVYAEGILNVCKLYVESPLACVAGVTGADLRKRVEAILRNRGPVRLGMGKIAALAVAAVMAVTAPLVVGLLNAPAGHAQAAHKFEVASIKLSKDCGDSVGDARGDVKKKGGGPGAADPSRVHACGTLEELIQDAYVVYANDFANRNGGRLNRPPLVGGPEWMKTDQYVIDAKAEGAAGQGAMHGSMMRALLEDRFRLKIRHEGREVDAYDLTVKNQAKLHPFQNGTCTPRDPNQPMAPPSEGAKPCAYFFREGKGPNLKSIEAQGTSVANFAKLLAIAVSRPVIDKSGVAGLFDFHMEFTPDESTPFFLKGAGPGSFDPAAASSEPPGPSIFIAMQESGMKLEASKGTRDFLVIDSASRPARN